jgi:hypothetical protein
MTTKDFNQIAYKIAQSLVTMTDSKSPDYIENLDMYLDSALEHIRTNAIKCVKDMHKLSDAGDTRALRIDVHGNFYLGDK